MADIRCPHCGKDNPDFLDVCQFCQSPLKPESMLHAGDTPIKKDTGELEPILPDWLKDARQQNREAAEEEEATRPKIPKVEPPDLLAGLASQAESDEEEVPDWLAGLNPVADKPSSTSASDEEAPSDFFAQFMQSGEKEPEPSASEPEEAETPSWMAGSEEQPSEERDELSDWFSQVSAESEETAGFESSARQDEKSWMDAPEPSSPSPGEPEKESEDLGWLRDLEAASQQTEEPSASQPAADFLPGETSDQASDDLSWLNTLGGVEQEPASSQDDLSWLNQPEQTPSSDEPAASQTESAEDDLSWLNQLGRLEQTPASEEPGSSQADLSWLKNFGEAEQEPAAEEFASSQPDSPQEDLDWLKGFGASEPAPEQPGSAREDMSWLDGLGGTEQEPEPEGSRPVQPESSQDDLSWLDELGSGNEPAPDAQSPKPFAGEQELDWLKNLQDQQEHVTDGSASQFSPPRTAPLSPEARDAMPDWLKKAAEEPSMPPLGAASLDWFAEHDKSVEAEPAQIESDASDQTQAEPASAGSEFSAPESDSASLSSQDVDSMFDVDMPDWLSREPATAEETPSETMPADDALAPVELPSWVQAMRPVESVLEETSVGSADQVTEKEGPLAGFSGVIPFAPIGSSRRPKAMSLKLQATEEQQASASLLEQVIADETISHVTKVPPVLAPQRVLRWVLSGLFLIVLSIVVSFGSRSMPIFAPASVNELSNLVANIPDNSPVLVVIDYEPSLAGELEAASGPLLDQLALTRHSKFTFLSMSANGPALVERLMDNTRIGKPQPDGLGYQEGAQYFNIGYLPGGSAGVLGFVSNPKAIMPLVNVNGFPDYAAVVVLTDHSESGRVWVEQLEQAKQNDPALANKPLLMVSSAQAGPMLQPYVSSGQVDGLVNGLSDAAKYELVNTSRPGIARSYWDAFGIGLMLAVLSIVLGSFWSLFTGIRARRAEAE